MCQEIGTKEWDWSEKNKSWQKNFDWILYVYFTGEKSDISNFLK